MTAPLPQPPYEAIREALVAVAHAPLRADLIDRGALVEELRRQVAVRDPDDDGKSWSAVFLTLAASLDGTEWLAP